MTRTEIDNTQDVIDSRDVIARIDELQADSEAADEGTDADRQEFEDNYGDELRALLALAGEAEGYAADWQHGEALIRDTYFTDYIWEMLEDCGDVPRDLPHYIVIDREATAENCKADYTSVDFDGVTYWIR